MKIEIIKISSNDFLKLGINNWPIWEKEISTFEWTYDDKEQFYLIEGTLKIITKEKNYNVVPGDFVTCPKGLDCKWEIKKCVKKHYRINNI